MRDASYFSKIYVCLSPVDLRKQVNGLSIIARDGLGFELTHPRSLFVFSNKQRSSIRMLYWDLTGFAVWSKRLEKDVFRWPQRVGAANSVALSSKELNWLLQGIDVNQIKPHDSVRFSETA